MAYVISEKCNGCIACVKFCPTQAISGEKKKLHKINQGQCIECSVCGRICPEEAVLTGKGQAVKKMKRSEWPKPAFGEDCVGCRICLDDCPFVCLDYAEPRTGDPDKHAKPYLKNEKTYVGCGICSDNCPINIIIMKSP